MESRPDRAQERAIGVLYLPQPERQSHYFEAKLASQFDALFHLDEPARSNRSNPRRPGTGARAAPRRL
ncbi:erythromycin esterase family protein [Paraburkholderia heleia]|uniref:erythromycin esterase family protein n=1 Tax=Paraburkholderia heleia TaxID=634127 RepID=UPI003CD07A10